MFNTIHDFETIWKEETESTLRIFNLLNDKNFHQKPHPDVRDAATLSGHIVHTIGEMITRTGMMIDGYHEDAQTPWTVAELVENYKQQSSAVLRQIISEWDDKALSDEVPMYGEIWTKSKILQVLVMHQVHHRGQLTIVMRLMGNPVKGVFGPAREEWTAFGMTPMD